MQAIGNFKQRPIDNVCRTVYIFWSI